jgi:nucleoside-diphosphate-sugar epimerase
MSVAPASPLAATPPASVQDVEHLEDLLSQPSPGAIETLARLDGDIMFLGVGGKMGPTMARMARWASDIAGVKRRIMGASRFSESGLMDRLKSHGIDPIKCDLLDQRQLDNLPDAPNVVCMTGMKFGSTGQAALTWAMNSYVPGMICQRYRHSRIVAFSTGNIYPFCPVTQGGSREGDPPGPVGEYAMSCLGRERIMEHFCRTQKTPLAIVRLYYANELRYGVLADIARRVLAGETIDLTMGSFNAVWQGDANAQSLQAFDHVASPPFVFNLVGPEVLSVRRISEEFARIFNRPVSFAGTESHDALLGNGELGHRLFGYPRVTVGQMLLWIADWVQRGGASLAKPTHFETRDGKY